MLASYVLRNNYGFARSSISKLLAFSLLVSFSFSLSSFQNFAAASALNQITIAAGSSLNIDSNSDFDDIDGESVDSGTLNISGGSFISNDQDQHIGRTNRLAQINIDGRTILLSYGDVHAAQINIEDGILMSFKENSFDEVSLGNKSSLMYLLGYLQDSDHNSNLQMDGDIVTGSNSNESGIYFMNYSSDKVSDVKINGAIASLEKQVDTIYVDGNTTLDLSDSAGVFARNIKLYGRDGYEPTVLLGSGVVDGALSLHYNDAVARIRVIENHELISSIGTENGRIHSLEVDEDARVNVANSVYVNSITNNSGATFAVLAGSAGAQNVVSADMFYNHGLADFSAAGDNSSFAFNIGASTINYVGSTFHAGSNAVTVADSITFAAGSTISVNADNPSQVGSIASNIVQVEQGVLLNVNIRDAHDFYDIQSFEHVIVESGDKDLSDVNEIQSSDVTVNSEVTNRIGLLTFSTRVSDNNLVLNVKKGEGVNYNENQARVVGTIDSIGRKSSSELLAVQSYLNLDPNATIANKKAVVDSLMPKNKALGQRSFQASNSIFKAISSRISSYKLARAAGNIKNYKTVDSEGNEVEALDDSATAQTSLVYGNDFQLESGDLAKHLWIKAIGSKAKQDNRGELDGYDASLQGLVVGVDKKIDNKTLVGATVSVADSEIDSSDGLMSIDSKIYQLSVYIEKEVADKRYYSLIAAASKGNNESRRFIPVAGRAATAKFDSHNFSLKGSVYNKIIFANGIDIVPQISLGYSVNKANDYQEQGAGALNLSVKTDNLEILDGSVAITTGYKKKFGSFILYPKIKLSYGYDFLQDVQTSVSNFQGHDLSFATSSTRIDPSTIKIAAGLEVFESEDLSFNAKYIQERRSSYLSHSAILEARFAF